MNSSIKKDKRFKVTAEIVTEIRKLRTDGVKLQDIADKFNVGVSTINYWTDDGYRNKMRLKNSKRKGNSKDRYKYKKEQQKDYTKENCLGYIEKIINTEKYKKTPCVLFGQEISFWIELIERESKFGILKID